MTDAMPIYLDNHATTRVDPRVLDEMWPWWSERFGNAGSRGHRYGREAEAAVIESRARLAAAIGASPAEMVITSGATESLNLAIKGAVAAAPAERRHLVAAATEHKAVLDCCKIMVEQAGCRLTVVPVDEGGRVDMAALANAITADTLLVAVMATNNELGVIQPIADIGALCRERGVYYLCDASQGVGRVPIDVDALQIDLLAFTGHKIYGPKGVGCLYVRQRNPRVQLAPLLHGGGQEGGLRSGTLAVPLIVGFAAAAELATADVADEEARIGELRQRLWTGLNARLERLHLNGSATHRVAGNLNVAFTCVDAGALMVALPDLALSSGAACSTEAVEPSHVLRAIGLPDERSRSSIRFGLGRFNTEDEIDRAIERVVQEVDRIRAASPLWEMLQEGVDPTSLSWG